MKKAQSDVGDFCHEPERKWKILIADEKKNFSFQMRDGSRGALFDARVSKCCRLKAELETDYVTLNEKLN